MSTSDINKNKMQERLQSNFGKLGTWASKYFPAPLIVGISSYLAAIPLHNHYANIGQMSPSWVVAAGFAGLALSSISITIGATSAYFFNKKLADPLKFWDQSKPASFRFDNKGQLTMDIPGLGVVSKNEMDMFSLPEMQKLGESASKEIDPKFSVRLRSEIRETRHVAFVDSIVPSPKEIKQREAEAIERFRQVFSHMAKSAPELDDKTQAAIGNALKHGGSPSLNRAMIETLGLSVDGITAAISRNRSSSRERSSQQISLG